MTKLEELPSQQRTCNIVVCHSCAFQINDLVLALIIMLEALHRRLLLHFPTCAHRSQ
jgi:phosphoribosylpyrophosphate synthetase